MADKIKKRGFTVIELLLVLSIFSILLSFSLVNLGTFSNLKNKIDVDLTNNNILDFINKSKTYCRDEKEEGGYIYFDTKNNEITFNVELGEIFKLKLPEGFVLNRVREDNRIKIDNMGITEDACSIKFKDRKGEMHCITMCVGTAYVDIKY
ncbi:type II secretion system protein [Clostridium sp. AWRP]|uniref:type II secretion system protein n=1 Tax=Clostridium sp. AWRP TaxID=2212991 RepID=UPI000FDC201B|nr:type II secretion system protein [Clostridium sp. AWRP]AZV56095.1 prepilin-type N-terminal cleavage/methylation domain-containing protein [Clostridium sp. AWRP]